MSAPTTTKLPITSGLTGSGLSPARQEKGCSTTPFFVFALISAVATLFLALTAYTSAFGTVGNPQPFQYATWATAAATALATLTGFAIKCCCNKKSTTV